MRLFTYIILAASMLASSVALAQMDYDKIELQATQVAGTVYLISGTDEAKAFSGGNIGVSIGDDGVLMVDAKFAKLADKIKAAIESIGAEGPKYILNTHVHGDHTGGNLPFQKEGTVIAHHNVRKRMMKDKPEGSWPVITFGSDMSFFMNGEEIQAMHFPNGHTDGDAIVFFKGSNVIHMGDHFFHGLFPFIDLDNGGSVQGFLKNIKQVIDEAPANVKIIPGHGPLATVDDLKGAHKMITETSEIIINKMKAGKSLEDITEEGLPEMYSSFHWGFITTDKWIRTIYNSFKADMAK